MWQHDDLFYLETMIVINLILMDMIDYFIYLTNIYQASTVNQINLKVLERE